MDIHGWGTRGFPTDAQWQLLKRDTDLGQWATHVSCTHLRWVFFSSPFCLLFSDLSITNSASCRARVTCGRYKRSSEIDRQVRKLIVVQDMSAGAQYYILPAFPSPVLPSLHVRSSFSFIHLLPAFFSPSHHPGSSIPLAALEKFPQYWFSPENPAGLLSVSDLRPQLR